MKTSAKIYIFHYKILSLKERVTIKNTDDNAAGERKTRILAQIELKSQHFF